MKYNKYVKSYTCLYCESFIKYLLSFFGENPGVCLQKFLILMLLFVSMLREDFFSLSFHSRFWLSIITLQTSDPPNAVAWCYSNQNMFVTWIFVKHTDDSFTVCIQDELSLQMNGINVISLNSVNYKSCQIDSTNFTRLEDPNQSHSHVFNPKCLTLPIYNVMPRNSHSNMISFPFLEIDLNNFCTCWLIKNIINQKNKYLVQTAFSCTTLLILATRQCTLKFLRSVILKEFSSNSELYNYRSPGNILWNT